MNDFFLVSCRNEFMENARLLIFETYCRIHQTIDISTLAQKLDMDQDAAERWTVNLIRNAHLDAKIDSAANHVIMGTQNPSMYAPAHPLARPCFRDGPRPC
jgi:translation initiation factor 3 subunit E